MKKIVAYIDLLGFKQLTETDTYGAVKLIHYYKEVLIRIIDRKLGSNAFEYFLPFSDSIFMVSNNDVSEFVNRKWVVIVMLIIGFLPIGISEYGLLHFWPKYGFQTKSLFGGIENIASIESLFIISVVIIGLFYFYRRVYSEFPETVSVRTDAINFEYANTSDSVSFDQIRKIKCGYYFHLCFVNILTDKRSYQHIFLTRSDGKSFCIHIKECNPQLLKTADFTLLSFFFLPGCIIFLAILLQMLTILLNI